MQSRDITMEYSIRRAGTPGTWRKARVYVISMSRDRAVAGLAPTKESSMVSYWYYMNICRAGMQLSYTQVGKHG